MTKLAEHQSAQITKMLLLGDSGSGKTGACASLASAGYNLRIIDTDSGLDVLANLLRDPKSPYSKDSLSRVEFQTLTDPMQVQFAKGRGKILVPKAATVWTRMTELLQNWPVLGPVVDWGEKDILVLDSLTTLGIAAMNQILQLNARLGQKPYQSDWYDGQILLESLLQMLYDSEVKCNVIVISHVTYIGEENGPIKGYPSSLGSKLPPRVGRYFNTILMAKTTGVGQNQKREILTKHGGLTELKNTAPLRVKDSYPIESGLADYFKAVREPAETQAKIVDIKAPA